MKYKNKYLASAVVVFSLLGIITACQQQEIASDFQVQFSQLPKTKFMLTEAQMQNASVKVADVHEGMLGRELLLTGVLKIDEQSVVSVSSRSAGRIQKLFFKNTGEKVNKGDPLYEFYSEDLLTIQREFKAVEDNNWNFNGRSDRSVTAENKLLLLGLLPEQIEQLKKSKNLIPVITVYSSFSGIVKSVNATEGQYVNVGEQIYELADDSHFWAEAQVYPNELQYISTGMPVNVIIPGSGDTHIPNKISFINPAFEPGSNVTLIRTEINNQERSLYPGMHILISLQTQQDYGIIIPSSALLIEKKGSLVWVQHEDGSFASRIVKTGIQSADSVLVLSGINETDRIVVSGVYLLNSEKILNKGADEALVNELVELNTEREEK